MAGQLHIKNKKARRDYELFDKFIAGIQLFGTEIKAIRNGKASINDSYCVLLPIKNKPNVFELWIKMHISEYSHGTYNNHEPKRDRKLLLHKKQLNRLKIKLEEKGLTIVPIRIYPNERGIYKVEIGVAKGRNKGDKREYIKDRETKRELKEYL